MRGKVTYEGSWPETIANQQGMGVSVRGMRGREGVEDVVVTGTVTCNVSNLTRYFSFQAVSWVVNM